MRLRGKTESAKEYAKGLVARGLTIRGVVCHTSFHFVVGTALQICCCHVSESNTVHLYRWKN